MCMTREEMNKTMAEIQEWKRIKEQAEEKLSELNSKAIEFLLETEECAAVDKKEIPFEDSSVSYLKLILQTRPVRRWIKQR